MLHVFGAMGSGIVAAQGAGGGAPALEAFAFDKRAIYTGDSIPTLDDLSGWWAWFSLYSWGRFQFTAGCRQAISGSEINEVGGVGTDILLAARMACLTAQLDADCVVLPHIGTNSVVQNTTPQMQAGYDQLWADIRATGAAILQPSILPSQTLMTGGTNPGLAAAANAYILAEEAADFCAVDAYAAWGNTYVGNTDSGFLHPNVIGAQRLAVAMADTLALKGADLDENPLYGAVNPSGNMVSAWDLAAGTAGGTSGTGTITGQRPTGITVGHSISGITVDCSIISKTVRGKTFPALRLTISGMAAAQGNITITQGANVSPTEQAGAIFESMAYLRGVAADGVSAPVNMSGLSCAYGSATIWGNSNTSAGAGLVGLPFEGVARSRAVPAIAAIGSVNFITTIRVNAGVTDILFDYGNPLVRRAERTAYLPAVFVNTGDVVAGGTLLGPTFTGTVANGSTITGRPGQGIAGGGLSFAYQWQSKVDGADDSTAADIPGATALAYLISGQSGNQLRMRSRITNDLGTDDAFTAWSTAVG